MSENWLLLVGFIGSLVVASVAGEKGRSSIGFFILSLIISPILAGILLLVMGNKAEEPSGWTCPHCKEPIRRNATLCKHCSSALMPASGVAVAGPWPLWLQYLLVGAVAVIAAGVVAFAILLGH